MQIIIDTANLSDLDRAMLAFLAGDPEEATEPEPEPEPEPVKKATATKKTAPAKKAEPEPEEDLVGGSAPVMADAVAAATQLVSSGQAAKVKSALAEVGAKRVSEMSDDDIPAFLAALEA
jgi:heme-binding NEAT domain protein